MQEKRGFERVSVDVHVFFKGSEGGNLYGCARNISMNGMFIDTTAIQELGVYILADLDVDSLGKVVWVQGKVVRTTSQGMAVEFARLDAKGIQSVVAMGRPGAFARLRP